MSSTDKHSKPLELRSILGATLDEKALTAEEALFLLEATQEDDLRRLREAADEIRSRQRGDEVTYTSGCSLFLTNLDELCPAVYGYSRQPGDNGAFTLSIDDIDATLEKAAYRGTSQISVSGGGYWSHLLIPGLESATVLKTYARLLAYIRERSPQLRIIGFSPDEIDFLSVVSDRSPQYILELLKDQGLHTLEGYQTGILSDTIRQKLSPKFTTVKHWLEIAGSASQLGLPVILRSECGQGETLRDRITHLGRVRNFLQKQPNAFTQTVPQMWMRRPDTPHTELRDRLKWLAVTRLFLGAALPSQQAFRMPDAAGQSRTLEEAQEGLTWGADSLGSTHATTYQTFLLGSRESAHPAATELESLITAAGRKPQHANSAES